MSDFDEDLIISLSKLLDQTGLSEIEIENKKVGRVKVAKNITQSYAAPTPNINNQIDSLENKSSEILLICFTNALTRFVSFTLPNSVGLSLITFFFVSFFILSPQLPI